MELKDMTDRLTEEQKKRIAEEKTEDDLNKLVLEDEQLDEVAGGWYKTGQGPDGFFGPKVWVRKWGDNRCPECGAPLKPDDKSCIRCRTSWKFSDDYNDCQSRGFPVEEIPGL